MDGKELILMDPPNPPIVMEVEGSREDLMTMLDFMNEANIHLRLKSNLLDKIFWGMDSKDRVEVMCVDDGSSREVPFLLTKKVLDKGYFFAEDDFFDPKFVGNGSYGHVVSLTHPLQTEEPVAVKITTRLFANMHDAKRNVREFMILKVCLLFLS